ncbi:hypothetical protein CPC_1436 [Clostridium perfringens C str. JGS1495]|uniref:Uncharacterized protein n=1 Tax=Clostridium perfringens E str. JGS1987 TaxID=451755 RepID=B1BRH6_CLOPF|nr:hypothetical protein CPC_1436 [Clostridium perfringens C str. JGS1495]EDT15671.1 hypothetical protein AC3_1615 [Clostridium perfringens E str. JGS1987]
MPVISLVRSFIFTFLNQSCEAEKRRSRVFSLRKNKEA